MIMIAVILIVAFSVIVFAIARLPADMAGLIVPLGCLAAIVVLIAAYNLCAP